MTVVRTVLGDLPPEQLGRTDYHEHLLQASPLLPDDDLDDVAASTRETEELRAAGIDALVELTPLGLSRDPDGLVTIARATGMHVVAATGVHREAHYPDDHWVRDLDATALHERFVREVTAGLDRSRGGPPDQIEARAGVVKVGTGYWSISRFERTVLEAAGACHADTGAPVVCHLEMGTAAWEVAEMLAHAGVARDRIVLAHMDRNPDPGLHVELAASGTYLGYDGPARTKYRTDAELLDCLVEVADRGAAARLLLGGDVARSSSFAAHGGLPGMAYLPRRFVPRLADRAGEGLVEQVLVRNPATAFAFDPPPPVGAGG